MIFGADSQNKNLKDAASKRIDTTPRTRTANKMSARIATSKTKDNATSVDTKSTVAHEPRSTINDGVSDPVRGSFEGLMNAPSTVIQQNGIGYANKSIQTARYKPKPNLNNLTPQMQKLDGFKKSGKINRYNSIAAANSSAHKMNSRLAIEKMFR